MTVKFEEQVDYYKEMYRNTMAKVTESGGISTPIRILGLDEEKVKADFVETLERILEKCFESEVDHSMEGSGCLRDKKDVVAYIKKYICENCEKDLSLDVLGVMVHLHPAYLSKIFKEVSDVNLSGYITDVKMQKAAELLEETDWKVQDVMKQLGYQKC